MIKTVEELAALPIDSVTQPSNGWVLVKDSTGWWSEDNAVWTSEEVHTNWTPATLLIPNTISQEKFLEALHRLADTYKKVGIVGAFEAALKLLGIEVSDV